MKELREEYKKIISLIAEAMPIGLTPTQINKDFPDCSPQNLNKKLKRLIKKDILSKQKEGIITLYRITPQGISQIPRLVAHPSSKQFIPPAQPIPLTYTTRAHKWGLAYPLKDSLDPREPPHLFSISGLDPLIITLKNNSQAQISIGDITVRLTTRTLELFTKDVYSDSRTPSIEAENALKQRFDALALDIEAKLQKVASFKLKRIDKDTLLSHITTQHWAEEGHKLTESVEGNHIILAYHPITGQARLVVDTSTGIPELETLSSISADTDRDTINSQFNGILDKKLNLWDINAMKHVIATQEQRYDRQFDIVDKLARQVDLHLKIMKEIDRKLSQKTLKEWG